MAGHCGKIGRYVWELGFEFWFHLTKVVPFSCWYGLAPSPLPLPQLLRELLLLLLNVHDNTHELTGRSWPPASSPKAPSTGPTAPIMIYLLHTDGCDYFRASEYMAEKDRNHNVPNKCYKSWSINNTSETDTKSEN